MSRKQEDRELAKSVEFMNGREPARYTCYICQRSRSWAYHSRHPPGRPRPSPGVCRRCVRDEEPREQLQSPPEITIHKIYYYHHDCVCKHEQACAGTPVEPPLQPAHPRCAELPAEDLRDRKGGPLSPRQVERVPPAVNFWSKPRAWSR